MRELDSVYLSVSVGSLSFSCDCSSATRGLGVPVKRTEASVASSRSRSVIANNWTLRFDFQETGQSS